MSLYSDANDVVFIRTVRLDSEECDVVYVLLRSEQCDIADVNVWVTIMTQPH